LICSIRRLGQNAGASCKPFADDFRNSRVERLRKSS
jgi:hypothetical protein